MLDHRRVTWILTAAILSSLFMEFSFGRRAMSSKKLFFLPWGIISAVLLIILACTPGGTCSDPNPELPTEIPSIPSDVSCVLVEDPITLAVPDGTLIQWWDGSGYVYVPPAEFTMGDSSAASGDNTPAHQVSLDGFWIQQTEVTNAMYAECVAFGVCEAPVQETGKPYWFADNQYANHPVVNVTWEHAKTYCEWVNSRLPSEAEWELAARGDDGRTYPWGDEQPSCQLVNYAGCLDPAQTIQGNSYPGGLSPSNAADMAGNVFEWVNDWFGTDYYASSPAQSPAGPAAGEQRVIRSSSYLSDAPALPVSLRSSLEPGKSRLDLGFRCVLTGEALSNPTLPLCSAQPLRTYPRQPGPTRLNLQLPPDVTLQSYCFVDSLNNPYGTASLTLGTGLTADQLEISSPDGSIACTPDQDNPQVLNCSGTAIKPDKLLTVKICHTTPTSADLVEPTCPVFYHLDQATNTCVYGLQDPTRCTASDMDLPGYGCLPAPRNGNCPVGEYPGEYNGKPVCIPAGGLQCQCNTCVPACPRGFAANGQSPCCDYPAGVALVCPQGYAYDPALKACAPEVSQTPACVVLTSYVPTCSLSACWITRMERPAPGGPLEPVTICDSPCPSGVVNGGECTP
jgi:hypothetical protein